ncbi:hypothetical protein VP01_4060g5 [Puccinia sorghi]|uniref:Uncharacterized protein n=1 Tax=Puccinia sorghi TaxID=27349 RepID=A0A0L6UTH2_9BASI|nr:hypothetical protein VP01_4060g5 [Puccinia sorghi]
MTWTGEISSVGLGARETGYGASAISQLVPFRFQTAVVALRPSRVKSSFNSKMSAHLCRQRETAVVNTLGITNDSRVFLRRSTAASGGFPYRQKSMKPKLNSRQIGLNILGSPTAPLDGLFKPSGTQWPRPPPKEPNQNTRANSILRKKFFTYFQECHLGVQIHVEKITAICSGNITNESAKKIAWDLLVELQAILTLFLTCARKIKSCGQAPTPSSLPEASDKSPSVHDLAQIISQLLLQLKICFIQMNNAFSRFEIIRATCSVSA